MSKSVTRRYVLQLFGTASIGILGACTQAAPTAAPAVQTAPAAASAVPAPARQGTGPAPVAVDASHPTIAALYDAARKEGKLAWWDAHDTPQVQQMVRAFNVHFPEVQVEYSQATEDVTRTRAVAEARAGRVSFDLLNTGQNWGAYKDAGLADATTDFTDLLTLAGVEPQFIVEGTCAPEFNVYGSAYNTDLVKEADLPDTLEGFNDPKWKGQIAVETRLRPYVYGTPFLGGEDAVVDMLKRLKANNPRATDGDVKSQGLLVAGEFPVLIGAYLQRLIDMRNKPWGFVPFKEVWSNVPRPGYLVPRGAPHPNAGKLFMWWFLGPEGQHLTDAVRFKGNPAPGTGTGPALYLEQHHIAVRFTPLEYDLNYDRYARKYLEALGLPVT